MRGPAVALRRWQVAAANPKAWNRKAHSAAEIATPTANNRYVVYPYTKLMNAFPTVDQSAAVIVTTVGHARALGPCPAA